MDTTGGGGSHSSPPPPPRPAVRAHPVALRLPCPSRAHCPDCTFAISNQSHLLRHKQLAREYGVQCSRLPGCSALPNRSRNVVSAATVVAQQAQPGTAPPLVAGGADWAADGADDRAASDAAEAQAAPAAAAAAAAADPYTDWNSTQELFTAVSLMNNGNGLSQTDILHLFHLFQGFRATCSRPNGGVPDITSLAQWRKLEETMVDKTMQVHMGGDAPPTSGLRCTLAVQ